MTGILWESTGVGLGGAVVCAYSSFEHGFVYLICLVFVCWILLILFFVYVFVTMETS